MFKNIQSSLMKTKEMEPYDDFSSSLECESSKRYCYRMCNILLQIILHN